ncbi:hypothetical protein P40_08130 [Alloalcanivorax xenomutans]|nr:hypothetical protein P40_08130 [Alloalcanivorax xenomutans]
MDLKPIRVRLTIRISKYKELALGTFYPYISGGIRTRLITNQYFSKTRKIVFERHLWRSIINNH